MSSEAVGVLQFAHACRFKPQAREDGLILYQPGRQGHQDLVRLWVWQETLATQLCLSRKALEHPWKSPPLRDFARRWAASLPLEPAFAAFGEKIAELDSLRDHWQSSTKSAQVWMGYAGTASVCFAWCPSDWNCCRGCLAPCPPDSTSCQICAQPLDLGLKKNLRRTLQRFLGR